MSGIENRLCDGGFLLYTDDPSRHSRNQKGLSKNCCHKTLECSNLRQHKNSIVNFFTMLNVSNTDNTDSHRFFLICENPLNPCYLCAGFIRRMSLRRNISTSKPQPDTGQHGQEIDIQFVDRHLAKITRNA